MPDFWLGTHTLAVPATASGSMAEPLLSGNISVLAVEVVRNANQYTVLLSSADAAGNPQDLECRVAFSNDPMFCNLWRDNGFPLIDAQITYTAGTKTLTVITPSFDSDQPAMKYDFDLVNITGIEFSNDPQSALSFSPAYRQNEQSPDSARPATSVCRRQVIWDVGRTCVKPAAPGSKLTFKVKSPRQPSLKPLTSRSYNMDAAWMGDVTLPKLPRAGKQAPTQRVSRVDTFGVPAFRFGDVEVLGFRIDLPHTDAVEKALEELIAPLNFHLSNPPGSAFPDFRYRATSYSLLLEVLRYGTMRLAAQDEPLTEDDYQSQHELLVRILVARVDDDASQARDPAVFVPAIFVDNPWSKVLGRDVQGFDKTLAAFCAADSMGNPKRLRADGVMEKLDSNGKVAGEELRPLSDITAVRLVDHTDGGTPGAGTTLLEIDCTPGNYDNWDELEEVGVGSALPLLSLADVRWRPSDFDRLEYTGSFLRSAISQLVRGFRSVQAAPVGAQDFDKAWITGKFSVEDVVGMSFPTGTASLTFHEPPNAPEGWKKVCALLAEWPRHDLHMGNWYRIKFAMDMTIDDGLEWTD